MPEIDDAEYQSLAGAKALLDKLVRDPRTKRDAERLIKTHHPEVVTTAEQEAPIMDEIKALAKRLDEDITSRKSREIDTRLDSEYEILRKEGWQPEGIEKLKKFQVERNIPSPLDAAGAWDRSFPKPKEQVSPLAPTDWGFGRGEEGTDTRALFDDEDRWAEGEARKAWADAAKERIET